MKIYEITGTPPATDLFGDLDKSIKQFTRSKDPHERALAVQLNQLVKLKPRELTTTAQYIARAGQMLAKPPSPNTPSVITPDATAMDAKPQGARAMGAVKNAFAIGHRRGQKVARVARTKRQPKQRYF